MLRNVLCSANVPNSKYHMKDLGASFILTEADMLHEQKSQPSHICNGSNKHRKQTAIQHIKTAHGTE